MNTFLSKAIVDTMVVKPPQVASIEHAQLEEANGRTRTPFSSVALAELFQIMSRYVCKTLFPVPFQRQVKLILTISKGCQRNRDEKTRFE